MGMYKGPGPLQHRISKLATMSCAIGNMMIAVAGGMVDWSHRRRSRSITKPIVLPSSRVMKDLKFTRRATDLR
ncbi:hypothetical protein HBI56_159010 [Parastagonospora nodorum]|nr:hypothetical protein HBH56_189730 [Parastagonospora nodorum]KAH3925163.1 hypothetical protein HBH54_185540 [Parastagonospora nodorum]KAH3954475.1 hypothetical protein HBH53_024890 [Parastagonospora nodorum]KAH3963849.1 hypothetical protein HBH51_164730 [Parastagonospora nodorum]KAH3967780.1 hypothetical protein HBH52_183570 [Parastagonospora nodorum]